MTHVALICGVAFTKHWDINMYCNVSVMGTMCVVYIAFPASPVACLSCKWQTFQKSFSKAGNVLRCHSCSVHVWPVGVVCVILQQLCRQWKPHDHHDPDFDARVMWIYSVSALALVKHDPACYLLQWFKLPGKTKKKWANTGMCSRQWGAVCSTGACWSCTRSVRWRSCPLPAVLKVWDLRLWQT